MIQFYHFHNSARRYVDLISDTTSKRVSEYLDVMYALSNFKRNKGSCFVYLPLREKAYFLQTNSEADEFAHGLIGDVAELKYEPTRYIGALESKYNEPSEMEVGERKLPPPVDFQLSATRYLHHEVAEIVEALLYTKKTVVVTGQNVEELIDCVKTVFKALPLSCSEHLGFAVAPSQIPNILDENMQDVKGALRLIATTAEGIESEEIRAISLGKSTTSASENKHLHPYSEVVRLFEKDLSDRRFMNFVASVKNCFDQNGTMNEKDVKRIVLERLFHLAHNHDSAMALLTAAKELKFESDDIVDAIEFLLGETVTEEALQAIDEARLDEEVKLRTKNHYGSFLLSTALSGHFLSNVQQQCVVEYLSLLWGNNDNLNDVEDQILNVRTQDIFSLLARAYACSQSKPLLRFIIHYTDIRETHNIRLDDMRDLFSAALFTEISQFSDRNIVSSLVAAVLCTCYKTNSSSINDLRFAAFREYAESKFPEIKERIEFLLDVKREENECIRMTEGGGSIEDFDFLPTAWLNSLTSSDSLSFASCLEIVRDLRYSADDYEALRRKLIERLQDRDELRANVQRDKLYKEYSEFFNVYKTQLSTASEIEKYLQFLREQSDVFVEFAKYRCDFVLDSYRTMGQVSKRDYVLRRVNKVMHFTVKQGDDQIEKVLADLNYDINQRQFVAEKVIDVLAGNCQVDKSDNPTNNGRYFLLAFLISFVFMIVASAIYVVPQVALGIYLGENILDRILLNLQFVQIFSILYVGLLNFLAYIVCWNKSNHDRQESLKRAGLITFLFAGLPIVLSEISFLIVYFLI